MSKRSKLAIFDFDGVIVDSTAVMTEGVERLFYPGLTKEMFIEASRKPIAERDKEIEETIERQVPDEKSVKAYQKAKRARAPLHPGMRTTIRDLSKHFYLALNTNAIESNCVPILKDMKLHDYFDMIELGGDDRTKVEKSENIMSELGVLPSDALFITDTAGDVLDAEEAGMPSIAVTWGVHSRPYFEEGEVADGIIAIVESADELYDAILEHFKR